MTKAWKTLYFFLLHFLLHFSEKQQYYDYKYDRWVQLIKIPLVWNII